MKNSLDRRIIRTKSSLIRTMQEMLSEMPFEKITVKDLCERAGISRITFYNYYSDKYALLEEMFRKMEAELRQQFGSRQQSNEKDDPEKGYSNLLDCVFANYDKNQNVFSNVNLEQNTILVAPYYHVLKRCTQDLIERYSDRLQPNYPTGKLASFLVLGIFGFIHLGDGPQTDPEKIRESSHQLLSDLTHSRLFTPAGSRTGRFWRSNSKDSPV